MIVSTIKSISAEPERLLSESKLIALDESTSSNMSRFSPYLRRVEKDGRISIIFYLYGNLILII